MDNIYCADRILYANLYNNEILIHAVNLSGNSSRLEQAGDEIPPTKRAHIEEVEGR